MTVHEQAAFNGFHKAAERDPEIARVAALYLKSMRAGAFGFAPFIGQNCYGNDIYDAYAFMHAHTMLCKGEVCAVQISARSTPVADRDADEQNRRLANIHRPFRAKFWGGPGDCDGVLEWDEPIAVTRCPFTTHPDRRDITIGPGSAPLEVGTTKASRTVLHLGIDGAVARWPYRSKTIVLFVSPTGPILHKLLAGEP